MTKYFPQNMTTNLCNINWIFHMYHNLRITYNLCMGIWNKWVKLYKFIESIHMNNFVKSIGWTLTKSHCGLGSPIGDSRPVGPVSNLIIAKRQAYTLKVPSGCNIYGECNVLQAPIQILWGYQSRGANPLLEDQNCLQTILRVKPQTIGNNPLCSS